MTDPALAAPPRTRMVAERGLVIAAICGWVIGVALRITPLVQADFPLNDGGLFSVMIDAVRHHHYTLPSLIQYNGLDIPFAYPPLAFYVAAVVADSLKVTSIDVLRLLPLMVNFLTMSAFYLLARTVLKTTRAALAALVILVLLPGSYQWLIGGGGLTRGFGLMFALLALRQAYLLATQSSNRATVLLALFAAGTVLSHLEMAWMMAYSAGLVVLGFGRTRANILRLFAAAAGAFAMIGPWVYTVLSSHGLAPFIAASKTGSAISAGSEGADTMLIVGAVLLLCVLLAATGEERLFFTGWLGTIALLDSRSLWLVVIPLGLAAGRVADVLLDPASFRVASFRVWKRASSDGEASVRRAATIRNVGATAVSLFIGLLLLSASAPPYEAARSPLAALSHDDRQAVMWIDANTDKASTFIVVTGGGWARDRVGEWLPVLTGRLSWSTVQGTEWLPDGAFHKKLQRWLELQTCGQAGQACLESWRAEGAATITHVYIVHWHPDCCAPLRSALRENRTYRVAYDGPTATIFERLPPE